MEEKFLPIGTVVVLQGGTQPVMITGFKAVNADFPGRIFDYRGCVWPYGVLETEGVALFDHSQIGEIKHMGFKNPESIDLSDRLIILEEQKKGTV